MDIIKKIQESIQHILKEQFGAEVLPEHIKVEKTRKEFKGDFTINVFPFLRYTKQSPEETANYFALELKKKIKEIEKFNIVKGFLNLSLYNDFWIDSLHHKDKLQKKQTEKIVLEFSSPNTNKPLHLGHIRNNLLGDSLSKILKKAGQEVIKVNLVNDRGIHICKSMLAWQWFGNEETPDLAGKKGDKFVGDYYVLFDKKYKAEIEALKAGGMDQKTAEKESELMTAAREMLVKWEAGDKAVRQLWQEMNQWVYAGFDETYRSLGIHFDKIYYESETYKNGKDLVLNGLEQKVFFKKEDSSVWVDLTKDGLDEKLLLRSDGTSVYITQDIGTYFQRKADWNADKFMYVVGNEQEYHFKVLKLILDKLGFEGSRVEHISYGMVNLPHGKMKSREGTVVDADDLIAEMKEQAMKKANELGKLDNLSDEEKTAIYRIVGLGALKYFILKVDAKKDMLFNPEQSVDFEGNTAPFIQYTYARIQSLKRKAEDMGINHGAHIEGYQINENERDLSKSLFEFSQVVEQAAETLNPSVIANYVYGLAKEFNKFYQGNPILKNTLYQVAEYRLLLSDKVGETIKEGLVLLGIEVPERM